MDTDAHLEKRTATVSRWKFSWLLFCPMLLVPFFSVGVLCWGLLWHNKLDVSTLERSNHPIYQGVDGSPDEKHFIRITNKLFNEGVEESNNFAATLIQTFPTDLLPDAARIKAKADFPSIEPSSVPLANEAELLEKLSSDSPVSAKQLASIFKNPTEERPLENDEIPLLKAVLELWNPALDHIVEQLDQRKCYAYQIPDFYQIPDDSYINFFVKQTSDIVNALRLRVMYSISEGDLPKAWRDIRAQFQIANRISQSPTDFEGILLASGCQGIAIQQLVDILNHSEISQEQIQQIERELPTLLEMEVGIRQMDTCIRAATNHFFVLVAERNTETISEHQMAGTTIFTGWFLPNAAVDETNKILDDLVSVLRMNDPHLGLQQWNFYQQQKEHQLAAETKTFRSPSAETTKFVIRKYLEQSLIFGNQNAQLLRCQTIGHQRQMLLAVALRKHKRLHQNFPTDLKSLPVSPELLIDPITGKEWDYHVQGSSATLWGPGIDERDDRHSDASKEDMVIQLR